MRYFFFFFLSCFISCSLAAQPLITRELPATGNGNTYALIIGVSKYMDPEIPQLQFANRDAEIFAQFLLSKAGGSVPKENIRLLTDSAATTAAVYDAVYWLKNSCSKDDNVYFYFSGHGDLENITMYNNGFLICYDSPPFNYVRLALSIDYLNDIANTLSFEKQANVILITDACHSGKLTGKKFKGNFLAGEQLRKIRDKEIRITSSSAEELSNEKEDWGGGRGVFSYYLVNGLQGLADKKNTGLVTVADIKHFLDSSFKNDAVLKRENIKQTPAVLGNGNFVLTKVDTELLVFAKKMVTDDHIRQRALTVETAGENIPASAEEYFFELMKKESLEAFTDSLKLDKVPKEKIAFTLIAGLKKSLFSAAGVKKLEELVRNLEAGQETLKRFNSRLAVLFDEVGHQKIVLYLKGDAAELEKRRYYNAAYDTYDIYPRMFEVALKLTEPDNYYYNIIRVKLHYFAGVALRLKIPLTRDQKPLIEKALAEQEKALRLEEYAPYIYNELGILYSYKKNDAKAEKYFVTASRRAPSWAIPLINLADLYAGQGKLEKAQLYIDSAAMRQPGLQDIFVSRGIILEKKEKRLQAEEAFWKSIKLNNRHFLPFERLGYVYMNNMAFAKADSVFNAAAERKKGFYFSELNNPRNMRLPKTVPEDEVKCSIDPNSISNTDPAGQFALGYGAYRDEDLATAETAFKKVIALDPKNPLAYHYLGKTMAEQKRYPEAEVIFKMALDNHLPLEQFLKYYDSLIKIQPTGSETYCIDSCFRYGYYDRAEDLLLLAQLYENWHHFNDAEIFYRRLIAADPNKSTGYLGLASLFEKTGMFADAENYLLEYNIRSNYSIDRELHSFYQRVTGLFPENGEWNLKAGNFQYTLARTAGGSLINDIKMTDPLTGETVYKFPQPREPKELTHIQSRIPMYGTKIPDKRPKYKYKPYTDGIYYFQKAALHLPYHETQLAGVYGKTGDLYNLQGLPDSALYFYEKAIELNPEDAGTRNKLVETYTENHLFSPALAQLDSLYRKKELSVDRQLLLAGFYMQDDRTEEAEKLLADAAQMKPVFDSGLTVLHAKLAVLKDKPKDALEYYNRLYRINNHDPGILYNIARIHAKGGNKTEAYKWLNKAISAGFNYTYVLQHDPYLQMVRAGNEWKKMISAVEGIPYIPNESF